MQLALVQVDLTKTAGLCLRKFTRPATSFSSPGHQAALRRTLQSLRLPGQIRFQYRGSTNPSNSREFHTAQEERGRGASRAPDSKTRMFKPHEPGENSGARCRTSQGLRPQPHPSHRPSPGFVLPRQCRAPDAVRRAPAMFVWRQPGAKPRSPQVISPPGPRIQALASPSLSALREHLLSTGPSAHLPGARESESSEELPGRGSEEAQEAGIPSTPEANSERKGGGAAAQSSRRSGSPGSPALLSPLPSAGSSLSVSPLRTHCRSQRARATAGARPLSTNPAPGRPQQPNPARVASLGSPGGSLKGPLP
ncbi:hypothetical protein NDU88_003498 [Pleurodeles waltl]|uniref:Uncharacterized protein n=1 Tax=Pleurodeles waltl TaxID=8319 RepID=A0AAV7T6U7_PLEWA|nr:hypothetical protein NDU88_003498 [Pleurodeles waltl]